ncbi:MAG: tetratricopeptide repeat protein [Verrucomicrobiota bacterium]
MGVYYANGEGVGKDVAEAIKWYRKSCRQNHASAQFNLGVIFDNGEGVAKDAAEAVKWYRKAAEQNHASAQFNLGVIFDNGEGVAKDADEAVKSGIAKPPSKITPRANTIWASVTPMATAWRRTRWKQ